MVSQNDSSQSTLTYKLKDWKEWCELANKDENDELMIEVRNSSFTGDSGCTVEWELSLSSNVSLSIEQAAGNIQGVGKLAKLEVNLAAGQLEWTEMMMPISIKLAAGNIELETSGWPKSGSSKIEVATGNVNIKSPKSSSVSTQISKAMGTTRNDFSAPNQDHLLKIELALGKVSHQSY